MHNKVLYLYENEMPTTEIFRGTLKRYDDRDHSEIVSIKTLSSAQFTSADVVVFIRPVDTMSFHLMKKAQKQGKFVITFCDDDICGMDAATVLDKKRKSIFKKCLKISDLFYTSSRHLAVRYGNYLKSGRTALTDTAVDKEEIIQHKNHGGKVRIVYAAGACHKAYFDSLIKPILNTLYSELGDIFSLTFIGVHPEIDCAGTSLDVRFLPSMPLAEYRHHMVLAQYDIGIAPISDDEFSKCKYFNKFLEYSMMGICGIYSDSEPYTYVVKNKVNGLLAGFSPDDWLEALKNAITDEQLRLTCVDNAQKMLSDSFSYESIDNNLRNKIPELNNFYLQQKTGIGKVGLSFLRLYYKFNRLWLYFLSAFQVLRKKGLHNLLQKIKNHF